MAWYNEWYHIASVELNDITKRIMHLTENADHPYKNFISDKEKIEWVPLESIKPFREFDRGNPKDIGYYEGAQENIDSLKKSILQEGFHSPLMLEYHQPNRAAYLGEGNHRLSAAESIGLSHVPVTVFRSEYKSPRKNIKSVPGYEPDMHNYVPGSLKPSEIGIQ